MPEDMFKPDETSLSQPSQEELREILRGLAIANVGREHPTLINDTVSAINSLTLKQVLKELIGEDEVLEPETEWYAKTKAHGGTHEEYWRLKAIINNNNNFRAELRQTAERIWGKQ